MSAHRLVPRLYRQLQRGGKRPPVRNTAERGIHVAAMITVKPSAVTAIRADQTAQQCGVSAALLRFDE